MCEGGTEQVQGIYHSRAFQDKDGSAGGTAANQAPHLLQSLGAVTFGSTAQGVFCTALVVSRESKASVEAERAMWVGLGCQDGTANGEL